MGKVEGERRGRGGSREKCIAQLKKKTKKPAHLLLWVFCPLKKDNVTRHNEILT